MKPKFKPGDQIIRKGTPPYPTRKGKILKIYNDGKMKYIVEWSEGLRIKELRFVHSIDRDFEFDIKTIRNEKLGNILTNDN